MTERESSKNGRNIAFRIVSATEMFLLLKPSALRKSSRPSSFDSAAAFLRRSTGAYVSWFTTSTKRDNAPPAMSSSQNTHRQPADSPRNPPAMGPTTGPIRGPMAQSAVALPRCCTLNKSAMTPAPRVRHAEPPMPDRRRQTMSVSMLGASAHPICQTTKNQFPAERTIRRP